MGMQGEGRKEGRGPSEGRRDRGEEEEEEEEVGKQVGVSLAPRPCTEQTLTLSITKCSLLWHRTQF